MLGKDWSEASMVNSAKTYTFDIEGHTIISSDEPEDSLEVVMSLNVM